MKRSLSSKIRFGEGSPADVYSNYLQEQKSRRNIGSKIGQFFIACTSTQRRRVCFVVGLMFLCSLIVDEGFACWRGRRGGGFFRRCVVVRIIPRRRCRPVQQYCYNQQTQSDVVYATPATPDQALTSPRAGGDVLVPEKVEDLRSAEEVEDLWPKPIVPIPIEPPRPVPVPKDYSPGGERYEPTNIPTSEVVLTSFQADPLPEPEPEFFPPKKNTPAPLPSAFVDWVPDVYIEERKVAELHPTPSAVKREVHFPPIRPPDQMPFLDVEIGVAGVHNAYAENTAW